MSDLVDSKSALVENVDVLLSQEVTLFLVDVSGSMSARVDKDYTIQSPSRIVAVREALREFVTKRIKAIDNGAKDKFGIITFGDDSKSFQLIDSSGYRMLGGIHLLQDPLSFNKDSIASKIDSLQAWDNTPMAEAVLAAKSVFARIPASMFRIVLLSDGAPNDEESVLRNVSEFFNDYGIVTDSISIGFDAKFSFLEKVAISGGGEFSKCASGEELLNKFIEFERERALLLGSGTLLLSDKTV